MPFSYDYSEPRRLLSLARLSSYQTSLSTNNDAELFGGYCWNLAIVSAFYPLLQLTEVALRNAISHAAEEKTVCSNGKYWIDCLPTTQEVDILGDGCYSDPEQVKNFKAKIRRAKKAAIKSLLDKGIKKPVPTLDQIISQTDFATWEYILDKHFYNGSNRQFLWPIGLTKAFKKLPRVTEKNAMFHQRDIIRRRVEEIRSFRNRRSHNEPAWRISTINQREDIIKLLISKLKNIMELLFWISPKFRNYVQDVGIEARIMQLLKTSELNRYMHSFDRHNISDLDSMIQLTIKTNLENTRRHFKIKHHQGVLLPYNARLIP